MTEPAGLRACGLTVYQGAVTLDAPRPLEVNEGVSHRLDLTAAAWTFTHPETSEPLAAQVPGCIHRDLLRHDLIPDPFWGRNEWDLQWISERDWTYRCRFEVAASVLADERVELVFEGLDTLATVRVNGQELGSTDNMFRTWRFNVKSALRAGANELEITFADIHPYIAAGHAKNQFIERLNLRPGRPVIRKEQCQFGWDWGPTFLTCGVWKPVYIEHGPAARLVAVKVRQHHSQGHVRLELRPLVENAPEGATWSARLSLDGQPVARSENLFLDVSKPQLWWPNGHGEQPLYELEVVWQEGGRILGTWKGRLGLRTVELVTAPDEFGEPCYFRVNGKAIFAKGADWIPAHAFVGGIDPELYTDLLTSAREANMNMVRLWGGGVYEHEVFYDRCDELGLLVWHDFMFACALYPADEAFLNSVRAEAEDQVRRLQYRTCIALWCGNNELEMLYTKRFREEPRRLHEYLKLFYEVIGPVVEREDGTRAYWPSSPHHPHFPEKMVEPFDDQRGSWHIWDVWHAMVPPRRYTELPVRFCAEFGMQSYPALEVAKTFCPENELNVLGPAFENHQKNGGGNARILHYVAQRYRYPRDYRALSYLSHLNQAHAIATGAEFWRSNMPRSMGALYWQLNDCWPVSSWASIDFGGRWKALQYAAKRFFAPVMVTFRAEGDLIPANMVGIVNTIDAVELWAVYDGTAAQVEGTLSWTLFTLSGEVVFSDSRPVRIAYNQPLRAETLSLKAHLQARGAENLILRLAFEKDGSVLAENTFWPYLPRLMPLQKAQPLVQVAEERGLYALTLSAPTFLHGVELQVPGFDGRFSDNYFDLFPGVPKRVTVPKRAAASAADLQARLEVFSLADTF